MLSENDARAAVLAAARGMLARGLTSGTSGNVSARLDGGTLVITPSGLPYQEMGPADLVVITMAGEPVSAAGRPRPVVRAPAAHRLLPGVPEKSGRSCTAIRRTPACSPRPGSRCPRSSTRP